MKSALLLASIGIFAAATGAAAVVSAGQSHGDAAPRAAHGKHDDHDEHGARAMRHHDEPGRGMQAVATAAEPGAPGDGWRYYTDPQAHRAVVISPQGEYYLSRGKGLRLVALTQAGE